MQSKFKFNIEITPFNSFDLDINKMLLMFKSKKPDLVILNHASNVFGNIVPIKEIFNEAKLYNAITVLDASQTAGLLELNLMNIKSDFTVFAGHKTLYGPSGIGGFIINTELKLNPLLLGGTGIRSEEIAMPEILPERYEVGSMNSLGIIGLNLSVEWLLETSIEEIYLKKQTLLKELFNTLTDFDELTILSPLDNNVGIISCSFEDYSPQDMSILLDQNNISVRVGLHCAPLAHKHMNTLPNGTVRFSLGYFNSLNDIKHLNDVLEDIL
jgi:selenocysteine lyase/cysteine desulfurase